MPPSKKRKETKKKHPAIKQIKFESRMRRTREREREKDQKRTFKKWDNQIRKPSLPIEKKWRQQDKSRQKFYERLDPNGKKEFLNQFGKYKRKEESE